MIFLILVTRLDLILNERVLTELTTAAGIADEFWVVAGDPVFGLEKPMDLLGKNVGKTWEKKQKKHLRWFKSCSSVDCLGNDGWCENSAEVGKSFLCFDLRIEQRAIRLQVCEPQWQAQTLRWLVRAAEQAHRCNAGESVNTKVLSFEKLFSCLNDLKCTPSASHKGGFSQSLDRPQWLGRRCRKTVERKRLESCGWCEAPVLPRFWCHWSEPQSEKLGSVQHGFHYV